MNTKFLGNMNNIHYIRNNSKVYKFLNKMDQNDPVFYLHNSQPRAIDNNIVETYL